MFHCESKSTLFGLPKEDTTRNQRLSCIYDSSTKILDFCIDIYISTSDMRETYLANAPVCICVIESVKCSPTTQNVEFLPGAQVLQACESSHYNNM